MEYKNRDIWKALAHVKPKKVTQLGSMPKMMKKDEFAEDYGKKKNFLEVI